MSENAQRGHFERTAVQPEADEPYDRQREEHSRDLLRAWADAASNAGCPPSFVARMRTFADMHDRHAAEAAAADETAAAAAEARGRAEEREAIAEWLAGDAQAEWWWTQPSAEHEQEYFAWASDRVRDRTARPSAPDSDGAGDCFEHCQGHPS